MNAKTAKLMRRFSVYTGIPIKKLERTWRNSTPQQQDEYMVEMKELRQLQFNKKLPRTKTGLGALESH